MELITAIIIGISLSMDSFAVAISDGLLVTKLTHKRQLSIALLFAIVQSIMPVVGWLIGKRIIKIIEAYDHWIIFAILLSIGLKMIYDGFYSNSNEQIRLSNSTLFFQSIATSIDAFAIGISFALLNVNIILNVAIIGIITFIFSLLGLYTGKRLGAFVGKYAVLFGGITLILLGVKILIEHLYFQA